ncbi:hypothetical protein DFR24_0613 [Panacagrimonas perspica]|uniref:Ferric reductase like protein n=1 Tax=Panacagrimonas perspica TaxID=381431 RepID=A0A4S3K3S4_9GAMM|nr:hypothetical protein [Panacagrimonas perspica]TDU31249.1 hypothetical protein DFR24_0613 [Panacagrimonas perspica]THD02598.1 hypothetical protein B1810_13695 [Panacagrimonas perspica]
METPAHVGFLRHHRYRYLKIGLILCALSLLLYAIHDPIDGPNGGTWLGYGLGSIGAGLILVLSWLGIRKRRYRGGLGQVKGWLSAHVYLGLALVIVGTLHTGFQFGWNVHTLAYVLMLVVITSGVYGIWAYAALPERITALRRGQTRDAMLAEMAELNRQSIAVAQALSSDIHRAIARSIGRVRIGGGVIAQLFGPAEPARQDFDDLNRTLNVRADTLLAGQRAESEAESTVMFIAGQIVKRSGRDEDEAAHIRQLLDILGRRKELVSRINQDIQLHARMQIWLYLHVPLTLALLAALLTHVISVFLYW